MSSDDDDATHALKKQKHELTTEETIAVEPERTTVPKPTIDWKKTPSFPPVDGSCTVWLPRKQRYCSHHATLGSTKCTTHTSLDPTLPTAAAAGVTPATEAASTEDVLANVASRKTNIDRHLKRMLNPFSIPALEAAPAWDQIYADPTLPLCIDIGCSKGLYIRDYRDKQPTPWNFLGVEIFEPYVAAANAAEAQRVALGSNQKNLHYTHANINNSLETLVSGHTIARVSLLFPDPWGCGQNKDHKNKKRRVMSASFAARLAAVMPPGSEFYLASDYEDLALDIRQHLVATGAFRVPSIVDGVYEPTMTGDAIRQLFAEKNDGRKLIDAAKGVGKAAPESDEAKAVLWLASIPLGVPTERDVICENQWRPVYRLVLERTNK
ncbi:Aste57867_13472 [Aphanomyces stellatus]|uniref:tRNA (guanine(46)-N(7))-methyltransferase n=1 Tax=Aphanomyces stellatus TaxID=120398 RepID=A0A485KY80_9STRA|nr:hypothetical protein As57867_013422 [Aphanomyces stellatus]VFT90310.1 Aste57867_13472 [Aphanomyces stellatus]